MSLTKILLFDTDRRGHHADYISCLIEYHQLNPYFELIIATDERLIHAFQDQFQNNKNLIFEEISVSEISQLHQQRIFKRSYNEWQLFCQLATKHRVTQGLLMYFDVFQVGLLFGSKPPCPVSGIYFRPDFHYKSAGWKATLNAFRKKTILRLILGKSYLNTLFTLDKTAVEVIASFGSQAKVLPVSDPVKVYEKDEHEVEKLRESLGLTKEKKTFLLFGFLDERKGIEKVLAALDNLDKNSLNKVQLVLVGVIDSGYKQHIKELIKELPVGVTVKTVFEEIKGAAIQRFFEATDYVLALYQNHVGMSQIVIRAAISAKPLISSNFGLMGELVETNSLGTTVDSSDPEQIAGVLKKSLSDEVRADKISMQKVASDNSAKAFSETIFNELAPLNPLT